MSIKILKAYDHIRKRPELYIGDTTNPFPLIRELIDNAVDELLSDSEANTLIVAKDKKTNSYIVADNGRGIPFQSGKIKFIPVVLATTLFSGGKFTKELYQYSTGLHGIGLVAVNVLSSELQIITKTRSEKDFHVYKFENGRFVSHTIGNNLPEPFNEMSTIIRFVPDETIFETADIPLEDIVDRLKAVSYFMKRLGLKKKLRIGILKKKRIQRIKDDDISPNLDNLEPLYTFDHRSKNSAVSLIIGWRLGQQKRIFRSYINTLPVKRGIHRKLVEDVVINTLLKKLDIPKDFDTTDLLRGCTIDLCLLLPDIAFSAQSKSELSVKPKYLKQVMGPVLQKLAKSLEKDYELFKPIVEMYKHRSLASALKKVKKSKSDTIDLDRVKPAKKPKVLYIVEGESAAGTVVRARDPNTEAVFVLRGKLLNVEKATANKLAQNKEIQTLLSYLNVKPGDCSKCRVEKIVQICDADPDGKHINALLLKLFKTLLPEIIQQGKLYVIEPPLYGAYKNGKFIPIYTHDEARKYSKYTRFKGLGEMDVHEMKEVIRHGKYVQVTFDMEN